MPSGNPARVSRIFLHNTDERLLKKSALMGLGTIFPSTCNLTPYGKFLEDGGEGEGLEETFVTYGPAREQCYNFGNVSDEMNWRVWRKKLFVWQQ
jgi:hypothetical protein